MRGTRGKIHFYGSMALSVLLVLLCMGWYFERGYRVPDDEPVDQVVQTDGVDLKAGAPITPIEAPAGQDASPVVGPGTVIVHVYTRDGNPASDCNVRLAGAGRLDRNAVTSVFDTIVRELPTDENGACTFSELPLDAYIVSAHSNELGGTGKALLMPTRQVAEIEIILGPGGYLAGEVTLEDGTPCAGARVFPVAQDGYLIPEDSFRALSVAADEQGRFHIPFLSARSWDILAEYPGYQNSGEKGVPVGSGDIRLVMRPGARLSGKVIDPERGEGVAGMLLVATQDGVLVSTRNVTGADGGFEFTGLRPGDVGLLGFHPTHVLVKSPSIALARDDDDGATTLEALPGAEVVGRLLDSGGIGLGDTGIGLDGPNGGRSAVSDAEGVYRFENVLPGNYTLSTLAASSGEVRNIQVAAGVVTNVPDWMLDVRALRVKVVDRLGAPVANAIVSVAKDSPIGGGRTDDDGGFVFVEPGVRGKVILTASKLQASSVPVTVDMDAEDIPFATLVLDQPRGMLGGRVVDQYGKPVKASVTLSSYEGRPDGMGEISHADGALAQSQDGAPVPRDGNVAWDIALDTDSDGYFLAHLDTPSVVKIVVADFSPYKVIHKSPPVAEVQLGPGQARTDLRLVLPSKGDVQISGKVVNGDGVPLPRIDLIVVSEETGFSKSIVSTSDGKFVADGLSGNAFEIQVRAQQGFHANSIKGISAGARDVLVSLMRPAKVFGTVIDRATNSPVSSFNIALVGWQVKNIRPARFRQVADAGGHFEIDAPPGSDGLDMEIAVQAPDYEFMRQGIGRIPADADTGPIEVLLDPGSPPIKGVVVDETGNAVGGARVTASSLQASWEGGQAISASSASDGTFQIAGLSSGECLIEVAHPDYASASVKIESGGPDEVRIVLSSGGHLEGWVTSGGVPLENVSIRIGGSGPVATDAEGHFQLGRIPAGDALVEVRLQSPEGLSRTQTLTKEIVSGASHVIHIEVTDGVASMLE